MTTLTMLDRTNLARALRLFAAVTTAAALSACGIDVNKEVNINPNPKIAYTVYAEAPLMPPENVVSSRVAYYVTDEKCVPIDHSKAIGGSRADSTIHSDLKINKVGNTYQVVVYDDLVSPKKRSDFSGCTWNIGSVNFYISKKGNRDPDATQAVSIGRSNLLNKTSYEEFCRIHLDNLGAEPCFSEPLKPYNDFYSFSISVK